MHGGQTQTSFDGFPGHGLLYIEPSAIVLDHKGYLAVLSVTFTLTRPALACLTTLVKDS